MELLDVIGSVATIVTVISFLTGIPLCRDIARAGSTKDFSSVPFIAGSLCTFLWLRYGFLLPDSNMIVLNTIGLVLQSLYLTCFFLYTSNKSQLNRQLGTLLTVLLSLHLYIGYADQSEPLIALLASLSSVICCAAPLGTVSEVIRSKSTEKLPFSMIFASFLVSSLWCLYGTLLGNAYIHVPNGIGSLISGVQLALFVIYPAKQKVK